MSPAKQTFPESGKPHWIEWVTGVVSGLLVASLVIWIAYEAVAGEQKPPELVVHATQVEQIAGGFRVSFDVQNRSGTTAAAVVVRGELSDGDETVEDAEITFDYVPAQSKSSGAVIFDRDPAELSMSLRPVGYTEP
ncbi:TIGR02588 family protein [Ciceribacter sp. L1K23]|uniref:TIGR02588 family protein n=1 Tax=unclassified Ciceribacter TaxID=2628820 RepID=UPI001ABE2848|nr:MULTISPECIES: TIGR02588 family protein [unclassified Ciceribacter]MBO3760837.1 TIGR02588 family protein [Ciceribacter sp. L1K22]MBR0555104.1 TIGR02588 family protein [Ciceribacter sp. L1K23]